MTLSLVNWPEPTAQYRYSTVDVDIDTGWADTGEGGLFAYLVVEGSDKPSRAEGGCNVDVHLTLSEPDVQLSGENIWSSRDPYPSSSADLDAAVFLGSTSHSLIWQDSSGRGDYFKVTKEDFSDAGKALYDALEASCGPVSILTFLDT